MADLWDVLNKDMLNECRGKKRKKESWKWDRKQSETEKVLEVKYQGKTNLRFKMCVITTCIQHSWHENLLNKQYL